MSRFLAHRVHMVLVALLTFYTCLCAAVEDSKRDNDQAPLSSEDGWTTQSRPAYQVGDAVPVTCLNRTIDTGEHVEDQYTHQLQYVPFPVCNETGLPLHLNFGIEQDVNCTIDFLTDEFYHLLEFYIHNDAPMSCRLPAKPLPDSFDWKSKLYNTGGDEAILHTPFTIALTGTLQLSHLHIANNLNVLLHAAPRKIAPGTIDAATAYSVSPADPSRAQLQKVIIGDALPLRLSIRWYPDTRLPPSWSGVGGHLYLSTLLYCLLSAGASAAVCIAYFRGVELPRRLRNYGRERLGINLPSKIQLGNNADLNGGLVRYNGYGYGIGSNGFGNTGKRD